MISVIEDLSRIDPITKIATVVLESDYPPAQFAAAWEELTGTSGKSAAVQYAATKGITNPALDFFTETPFPVDEQGNALTSTTPEAMKTFQAAKYRIRYTVRGR